MARYSAGTQTGAGSVTIPIASLFANGACTVDVIEIGIFNATTIAFDIGLYRYAWAAAGTVGAAITKGGIDNPLLTSQALAYTTAASGGPAMTPIGYRAQIGAAIGAGVIWTFGGEGLMLAAAAGTLNGIGIMPPIGTGQVADVYFVWDE